MAVTKIKPIRGTVNKALAYILAPQKTDDAFYVSSYGCAASDAAAKEYRNRNSMRILMFLPHCAVCLSAGSNLCIGEISWQRLH